MAFPAEVWTDSGSRAAVSPATLLLHRVFLLQLLCLLLVLLLYLLLSRFISFLLRQPLVILSRLC